MPHSGQMIDSHLVTSLHDKKSRRGKRRHQSIQALRCGAQKRDALFNSKQQGPRSDSWCAYLLPGQSRSFFVPANCSVLRMFNQDALYLDRSCLREPASS